MRKIENSRSPEGKKRRENPELHSTFRKNTDFTSVSIHFHSLKNVTTAPLDILYWFMNYSFLFRSNNISQPGVAEREANGFQDADFLYKKNMWLYVSAFSRKFCLQMLMCTIWLSLQERTSQAQCSCRFAEGTHERFLYT